MTAPMSQLRKLPGPIRVSLSKKKRGLWLSGFELRFERRQAFVDIHRLAPLLIEGLDIAIDRLHVAFDTFLNEAVELSGVLFDRRFYGIQAFIDRLEAPIHGLKLLIDAFKAHIHLATKSVDLGVELFEPTVEFAFDSLNLADDSLDFAFDPLDLAFEFLDFTM